MNGLEETLRLTLRNLSEACAADSVVGKPMVTEDGSVTIPVSRVSYGIVTGGGEGEGTSRRGGSPLAAAGGCGMTVTPVGFLVLSGREKKFISVERDAPAGWKDLARAALGMMKGKEEDD